MTLSNASRGSERPRWVTLLGVGVAAALGIAALQVVPPWLSAMSTPPLTRRLITVFLNGVLAWYLVTLGLAMVGA
ncbi:MAG: hypothetical protein AB7I30_14535, partial [Isosphaeraceae bacterium]